MLFGIEELEQKIQVYALFENLLLEIPSKEFIESIASLDCPTECGGSDEFSTGLSLMAEYVCSCKGRSRDDVFVEISVDRTRLLRGLMRSGPRPPYESLFVGTTAKVSTSSVIEAYRLSKCKVAESVKDSPEHLGVEMAFMGELCSRELAALKEGRIDDATEAHEAAKRFMRDHIGRWGAQFGDEMLSFATTDFYRGVAHLLKGFIVEEVESYQAE